MKIFLSITLVLTALGCKLQEAKNTLKFVHYNQSLIDKSKVNFDTLEFNILEKSSSDWKYVFQSIIPCNDINSEILYSSRTIKIISVECKSEDFILFIDKKFGLIKVHKLSETQVDEYTLYESKDKWSSKEINVKIGIVEKILKDMLLINQIK